MADDLRLRYRAFISYSHADTAVAKWLHTSLERFKIDKGVVGRITPMGPIPKSLRPIFRDRDEFAAGSALSEQTIVALDQSNAVIVLCSPTAARSEYVNEEIRLFKSRHPERPVIPVVAIAGAANIETDCFPPALRYEVRSDGVVTDAPISTVAADLRQEGDGKELALAKIVARLIGLSTDDVFGRAQRERRRQLSLWITGLSVVSVMLAALAAVAIFQRYEAVTQRSKAERNAQIADERRAEAERNFALAKQGADALIFRIAQGLRDQHGMRLETVGNILQAAEGVVDDLVRRSNNNKALLHSQAAMLDEFSRVYADQNDILRQEDAARKSLSISRQLAEAEPNDADLQRALSVGLERFGDVLAKKGQSSEALDHYNQSLAIAQVVAKVSPDNASWQRDLSVSHYKIGKLLVEQGRLAQAAISLKNSLDIAELLSKGDPANGELQRGLSLTYQAYGDLLYAEQNLAEALTAYQSSLTAAEKSARADDGNTERQFNLGLCLERLGNVLTSQDMFADARAMFARRHNIIVELSRIDPGNAAWQRDLAVSHSKLGDVDALEGETQKGREAFHNSRVILERLASSDAENATLTMDLVAIYAKLGALEPGKGWWRKAHYAVSKLRDEGRLPVSDAWKVEATREQALTDGN